MKIVAFAALAGVLALAQGDDESWLKWDAARAQAVGKAAYVPACALAAVAYGADGLCIEAHVSPSHGLGDDFLR